MKYIHKPIPEPSDLNHFRLWVQKNATRLAPMTGTQQWKAFKRKKKEKLQDFLIKEQGYICAYCNRRIHKYGEVITAYGSNTTNQNRYCQHFIEIIRY